MCKRESSTASSPASAADLVRCDGGSCANVDTKGKRYGIHGEYVPIKQR